MSWLTLGLLAAALGAAINTIDKVVVVRYLNNVWVYPFLTAIFLAIYSVVVLLVRASLGLLQLTSLAVVLIALVPGFLHYINSMLYTKALMEVDASTVQALNQTRPIFTLGWGFLVFGDNLRLSNYFGVFLIVVCAMLLALERSRDGARSLQFNKALIYVVLAAVLFSISDLSMKLALEDLSDWDTFGFSRVALIIPAATVFSRPLTRKLILDAIRERGLILLLIIGLLEAAVMVILLLTVMAFSRGPLALVSTTQSTTVMFVLGYTLIANWIRPGLVPLKNANENVWVKTLLCLGIIAGVYFLSA